MLCCLIWSLRVNGLCFVTTNVVVGPLRKVSMNRFKIPFIDQSYVLHFDIMVLVHEYFFNNCFSALGHLVFVLIGMHFYSLADENLSMVFFQGVNRMTSYFHFIEGHYDCMSSDIDIAHYWAALKPSSELPAALPKFMKAEQYAALSGYSYEAIRQKCYQGIWPQGIIWQRAPDRHLMINWRAADIWIESENI